MKRLILLRHGRTTFNHQQRIQGQLDAPLDAAGLAQAAEVAPLVAALSPVVIWSSDLARAAVTADHVAEACGGLPVTRDARLRERHFGDVQNWLHSEFKARLPEQYAAFRAGDPAAVPGAEKISELSDRLHAALIDLLALTPEGETALAVAHGLAIKYAVGGLLGWDEEASSALRGMDNCHWAEVEIDSGRATLAAYNLGV
ncbi:histidine phosphatase family protein [Nocardioides insulae]|uniref:histidine phosphatase family protein n=1 Tax=Nocardioides insulae TaxID=394734 RepID=UPI00041F5527|nr:histidine phosphatase family protein [Nocardioides insulae]